jgi:hypothetical protein
MPTDDHVTPPFAMIGAFVFAGAAIIRGAFLLFDSDARGSRIRYKWESSAIANYTGNIPEYALEKALQIKTRLPETHFQVERLVEETETIPKPKRDPFLIAILGNERYYIEVWNEKEYEAKL